MAFQRSFRRHRRAFFLETPLGENAKNNLQRGVRAISEEVFRLQSEAFASPSHFSICDKPVLPLAVYGDRPIGLR